MTNDTIVALAGAALQAVAIIRLSGEDCKDIAGRILKEPIDKQTENTIIHNYVISKDKIVDEVLVSYFKAPFSYTGEDVVEINIHGGRYLGNKIVDLLLQAGAKLAEPGEFTQRAFLNGKLDLSQAEAINDLVKANTAFNAEKAISGLGGSITKLIGELIEEIKDILENLEVNIDYPEYDDVTQLSQELIKPKLLDWHDKIEEMIKESELSMLVKEGILTVIIGEPNVGKSSLLNALLKENRALVSTIAGTTRDYLEEEIVIDDLHLRLIDTAGLREAGDDLEKLGIEKTEELLTKAQLVILVLDATKTLSDYEKDLLERLKDKEHIIVANKTDLNNNSELGIKISAVNNDIDSLINELKKRYDSDRLLSSPTLNSYRQLDLIKQAKCSLQAAIKAIDEGRELELVAIDITQAYQALCDILGRYNRMDLLDSIFRDFWLAK